MLLEQLFHLGDGAEDFWDRVTVFIGITELNIANRLNNFIVCFLNWRFIFLSLVRFTLLRVFVEGILFRATLKEPLNVLALGDEIDEFICSDVVHLSLLVYLADQFDGVAYLDFLAILIDASFKPSRAAIVAYNLGNLLLDHRHQAALIRGNFRLFKFIFILDQDDRFVAIDDVTFTYLIVFFFGFHIVFKQFASVIEGFRCFDFLNGIIRQW